MFATVILSIFVFGCRSEAPKPTISLIQAARDQNVQEVRANLAWGAPVNEEEEGFTALDFALGAENDKPELRPGWMWNGEFEYSLDAEGKNEEVVLLLLEAKAKTDEEFSGGLTYLHFAAREGMLGAVTKLIDSGINVDQPTRSASIRFQGNRRANGAFLTPLHVAIISSKPEMVRALLSKGADKTVEARYNDYHARNNRGGGFQNLTVVQLAIEFCPEVAPELR